MFFVLRSKMVQMFIGGLLSLIAVFFISTGTASADTLLNVVSYRAHASSSYLSTSIDTSTFTNLRLSFDFDATTLDFGPPQDSFVYGYLNNENEYLLGTHLGLAGSTTAESGTVTVSLPELTDPTSLQIYISVTANSTVSSDKVELRNVILTGEPKPIIADVCLNIAGSQETVPNGYQTNTEGECVVIPPPPVDICLNLIGLQEVLPQGYEMSQGGDCVLVPLPIDICPNLLGEQNTIPNGYQKDEFGDCVVIPPAEVDLCPNLSNTQITIPGGMVVNNAGECVVQVVLPVDFCPNLEGDQAAIPNGLQLNSAGECIAIVVVVSPTPKPKQCPRGFSKWIDKFKESYTWRADDVYQAVILAGGPTSRSANRDRAHFLYIAGPTEVGDKYYRRFHKISLVCVKG